MIKVLQKRVYDLAGILGKKVNVYLNNSKIKLNSFSQYVDMYLGKENESKVQLKAN